MVRPAALPGDNATRTKIQKYWSRIRTSFWFVPTMMAAGAALLALGTVSLDESLGDDWKSVMAWA